MVKRKHLSKGKKKDFPFYNFQRVKAAMLHLEDQLWEVGGRAVMLQYKHLRGGGGESQLFSVAQDKCNPNCYISVFPNITKGSLRET